MSVLAPERPKTKATTADVLRRVKELIPSEHFWCQLVGHDDEGRMCLGYALHQAVLDLGGDFKAAADLIHAETGTGVIPFWNDAPRRTFADVERVLDSAIYKAECLQS